MPGHAAAGSIRGVDRCLFLVEAYRPSIDVPASPLLVVDGETILAVIEIAADEVALALVAAADADRASRFVEDRGVRPIRVVAASWFAADRDGPSAAEAGSGNLPM
jgi:hypothetical protein